MANGLFERPKVMTDGLQVEVARVSVKVVMRYVEANFSYDILLELDWLKATKTEAKFKQEEYLLGRQVSVRQMGRIIVAKDVDE